MQLQLLSMGSDIQDAQLMRLLHRKKNTHYIGLLVLEEEGLSSDLGHGIKHHGLTADVHWGYRALCGGRGIGAGLAT